jgi:hypothetical protein
MPPFLKEKLLDVLKAVTPLIAVVCVLEATFAQAPIPLFLQFLAGVVFAIAGMTLLFIGIDLGILPMGRFVGAELPKKRSLALIMAVVFTLGFATTVAEPDVLVLAGQVDMASRGAISGWTFLMLVGLGVAAFAVVAMARIIFGWSMKYTLAATYSLVLALSIVTPDEFVPLAFDGGSVTTGVLSAPVIIALGIGLSSVLAGRSAVSDSFGVLGFASVGPIIAIVAMGIFLS